MRTLRVSLVGTVILALLAGLSGAVVAQDEPADPMAPVVVTGTIELGSCLAEIETFDAAGVSRGEGRECIIDYEASDPRLDGEVTLRTNRMWYEPWSIYVEATTRVLVSDDGRWVGTDTSLALPEGMMADIGFIVMHGEDAYEGSTAIIWEDWEGAADDPDRDPYSFVGAIVPEMPAFPELPAE